MYIWNIFKALIYLLFCSKKFTYSEPNENQITKLKPINLNVYADPLEDEYTYQKINKGGIYTVNDGYGFASVKAFGSGCERGSNIWKATNSSEYANKIELFAYNVYGMYKLVVKLFNGNKKEYFKQIKFPWIENKIIRNIPITLNIYIQYNTYFYTVKKYGNTKIFTPRRGFIFNSIIYSFKRFNLKIIIWQTDNLNECAKKVEYIVYKSFKEHFAKLIIYSKNGVITKLFNDDLDDIHNTWNYADPKGNIPVQICIENIFDSMFSHTYSYNGVRIYEAKDGFVFNSLKKWVGYTWSTYKAWTTQNPDKYAYKVIINGVGFIYNTQIITIFHMDGEVSHLNLLDDDWAPIDPCTVLNINYKKNNMAYNYFKDKKIEFFIPNGNYLFKGVTTTEFYGIKKIQVNIWYAKNSKEYAKKVFIVNLSKNFKYLVLFLINNKIVIFCKLGQSQVWTIKPTDINSINELKKFGVDFSDIDATKNKILKQIQQTNEISPHYKEPEPAISKSKYLMDPKKLIDLDINKVHCINKYDIIYKYNKVIYITRSPYLFKSVTNNNEVLWQSKNSNEYPNKIIIKEINGKNKIKVYFPDDNELEVIKNKPLINYNPSDIKLEV